VGAVALLLGAAQWSGLLLPVDRILHPLLQRGGGSAVAAHVVEIRRTEAEGPWTHGELATLIDGLSHAGVRRIGLDLDLAVVDTKGGSEDARLAAAIRRAGRVVLRTHIDQDRHGTITEQPPLPLLAAAADGAGHDKLLRGRDGIIRIPLWTGSGGPRYPAFAALMAEIPLRKPIRDAAPATMDRQPIWQRSLLFHLSRTDTPSALIAGALADSPTALARLRGQRVVISEGACAPPASCNDTEEVAGLQAQAVKTLLSAAPVQDLPQGLSWGMLAAGLLLGTMALQRAEAALVFVGLLLAVPLISWLLLHAATLWWSPTPLLVGLASLSILQRVRRQLLRARQAPDHGPLATRHALELAINRQLAGAGHCSLLLVTPKMKTGADGRALHLRDPAAWSRTCLAVAGFPRRPTDLAGQWGEDCLALVLPETSTDGAQRVAEMLREHLQDLYYHDVANRPRRLALAIGSATAAPAPHRAPAEVITAAEASLAEALRHGL